MCKKSEDDTSNMISSQQSAVSKRRILKAEGCLTENWTIIKGLINIIMAADIEEMDYVAG